MAQDLVINGKRFEDVKQLAAKNANGETVIYSESAGGGSGLLQIKSVRPGKDQQIVKPDTGYYGLESVTVSGDKNLSAENIKAGVNIFGVNGSYEGSGGADSASITWDGDTTGKLAVPIGDEAFGQAYYKVSDRIFSDAEIQSGTLTVNTGATANYADHWEFMVNSGYVTEDAVYAEMIVFVRKAGAEIHYNTFPETGVYFVKSDNEDGLVYATSFAVAGEGEQATPEIAVSGSGLITATAGDKSATKQLDTAAGKTVTPGTEDQVVVPAERFTTGDVIVKGDANLKPENIAKDVTIFGVIGEHEGEGGSVEQATPEITVDENGLIIATAGDKSAARQLSVQRGKTVIPGPTEQIAVVAGKYVTEDVKVAAVQGGGGGEQGSAIVINGPEITMSATTAITTGAAIFEQQVVEVEGATYGFALNDAGYYESQNKGKANSYAMCKVLFNATYQKQVGLKCINYAQKGSDYGLISNVDTMLSMDNVEDSEGVFKSFVSSNSAGAQTINITIPPGEHFICIKFIKNGSTNSNNDSLQFMVT